MGSYDNNSWLFCLFQKQEEERMDSFHYKSGGIQVISGIGKILSEVKICQPPLVAAATIQPSSEMEIATC